MKRAVIALILIACTIAAVVCLRVKPANAGLPIVQSAAPSQPAYRLFTPCPIGRRNVPILPERTA